MAVLISAPLPNSVQLIGAPTPLANQPSPLAIMVGLASRKKPTLTFSGALGREAAAARTDQGGGAELAVHEQAAGEQGHGLLCLHCVGWAPDRPAWPPLSPAGPVHDTAFEQQQQAVDQEPHQADHQDADEDVVGAQEAAGIEDHPAEPGAAGDDLGRDQRAVDDADREPGAGEDLGQRRGQDTCRNTCQRLAPSAVRH